MKVRADCKKGKEEGHHHLSLSLTLCRRQRTCTTWRIRIALTPWPFCQMCFENACKTAAATRVAVVAVASSVQIVQLR